MADERTIARVYTEGFRASDIRLAAGLVLVSPVRPPERTEAGIVVSLATTRIEGTRAILYRVEAIADGAEDGLLVGDVVVLRNALLDPIHPDLEALVIRREHIVGVLRDA